MTSSLTTRSATIRAMLLVLVGSTGMQIGAAISLTLFGDFGPAGTSGLRMLIAAVIMMLVFRPRIRGRSPREWAGIVLYGTAMAAMNLLLYQAIERLPLGVATTLDFLGPCMVAFFASRRLREGLLAIAAFTGVALMAGFGGPFDPIGLVWGVLAGASFAAYTVLAPRIGQAGGGLQSVALSLVVAAVLTTPFSLPVIASVTVPQWGLLALSALVGTALAFSVDTIAGKLTSARTLGVFFAFDPVLGTLVGALFLDQVLTPVALVGILLVVVAGGGIVWLAGQHEPDPKSQEFRVNAVSPAPASESLEIERKYEVGAAAELPGAHAFVEAGFVPGSVQTVAMVAQYFDTVDGQLGRIGVAVRKREGGSDEGWHLKAKGAAGTRELHWPLALEVPAGLRRELSERIGAGAELIRPIAELRTARRIVRLTNRDGVEVVELADDSVRAVELRADGSRVDRAWREWEAELLAGADPEVLDRVEAVLLAAGAAVSPNSAKIARATGTMASFAAAKGLSESVIAQLEEMDRNDRETARRLAL